MKDRLVILYAIGTHMVGGAETQLFMLAAEMKTLGHDVHLFVVEDNGPLASKYRELGISLHSGGFSGDGTKPLRILKLLRAQIRLITLAIKLRPNILHGFLPLTNGMIALAGLVSRAPLIVTSRRALGLHQERVPFWKPIDRFANWASDVVTANSNAVAADVKMRDGIDPRKLIVIYNGVDLPATEPSRRVELRRSIGLAEESRAIVSVANLIPYKGHREMVLALAELATEFPAAQLVLVGEDRGIGSDLRALIVEKDIADRVLMLGRRADVPNLLQAMDMGVLASHEEGFSNALLEMLHAGLPVVATRVGGNVEALENMPGCFLVPPNEPHELAAALRLMLTDESETPQRASARSGAIRAGYSRQAMRDAYCRLYQSFGN